MKLKTKILINQILLLVVLVILHIEIYCLYYNFWSMFIVYILALSIGLAVFCIVKDMMLLKELKKAQDNDEPIKNFKLLKKSCNTPKNAIILVATFVFVVIVSWFIIRYFRYFIFY